MSTKSGGVSKFEKLLKDLRKAEPTTRQLMLADIARDYGDGFAETLRKQVAADIERRRK